MLATPGAACSLPHHATDVQSHEISKALSVHPRLAWGGIPTLPWSDAMVTKGVCASPHVEKQKSLQSDVFLSHGSSGL